MTEKNMTSELKKICRIYEWNPSPQQLISIRDEVKKRIQKGERLDLSSCQQIISKHCPSARLVVTEGVDNSDLNTLLMLALKKGEQANPK